jgi:hypothetical protein
MCGCCISGVFKALQQARVPESENLEPLNYLSTHPSNYCCHIETEVRVLVNRC